MRAYVVDRFRMVSPASLKLLLLTTVVAAALALPAAAQPKSKAWEPFIEKASDEGEMALGQFSLPPGFKADLFAAEPRLAHQGSVIPPSISPSRRFAIGPTSWA